jgi:hypothetical protein
MVKDRKFKKVLLGGMLLSIGWCINLFAQTPAAVTPKEPDVKVADVKASDVKPAEVKVPEAKAADVKTEVKAEMPSMPQPTSVKDTWKPEPPAKDAKEGVWKLIDPGALNVNLKLKKIAVGDVHDVLAVGEDGKIYKLTAKGWEAIAIGVDVAATEDDTILMVNDKDELLKLNKKGEWDLIKDVKANRVAAGNNDAIWVFYQGQVSHFDHAKWEKVKNMLGQDAKGLTFFAVNAEEVVYALDDKNNIYRRDLDRVEQVQKTAPLRAQVVEKQKQEKEKQRKEKQKREKQQKEKQKKSKQKRARAAKVRMQKTKKQG